MTPAFHDNEGPPPVGYFTYSVVGDHWSWSDGMYSLHGFERGDVTPSTAILLAHLHPDDRSGRLRGSRQRDASGDPVHLLPPRHRSSRAGALGPPRRSRRPRRPWPRGAAGGLRRRHRAQPGILSPRAVRPGRHRRRCGSCGAGSLSVTTVVVQCRLAVHGVGETDASPAISWSARPRRYADGPGVVRTVQRVLGQQVLDHTGQDLRNVGGVVGCVGSFRGWSVAARRHSVRSARVIVSLLSLGASSIQHERWAMSC